MYYELRQEPIQAIKFDYKKDGGKEAKQTVDLWTESESKITKNPPTLVIWDFGKIVLVVHDGEYILNLGSLGAMANLTTMPASEFEKKYKPHEVR